MLFIKQHKRKRFYGVQYSFVKEQALMQYGTRLADEGYATLIFDPRALGEITG